MAAKYKGKYIVDIEYFDGYYKELSPLFINFSLLVKSMDPPSIDGDFTYCELGCGKALSLLIMAENFPNGQFYGIDFNTAHIKYGKYLAKKAGLKNIHFYNMSFGEALKKKNKFPDFDYIVFHGVYSWVSRSVRKDILKFCGKKINVGGVVYNSYNALPGSIHRMDMQKLLLETSHTSTDRSDERMDYSIKIIDEFLKQKSMKSKTNLIQTLEPLKKQDKNYLPHEYLNISSTACYFIDVEKKFAKKSLDFAGVCSPMDAFSSFTLPPDINNFLNKHFSPNTPIFEHFKDYLLNTTFRKDLYIKGIKMNDNINIKNTLNKYKFIFSNPNTKLPNKIDYLFSNIAMGDDIIKHFSSKLKQGAYFEELILKNDISSTLFYMSFFISKNIVNIIIDNNENKKHNLNKVLCDEYITKNSSSFISAFKTKDALSLGFMDRLFYKFYDKNDLENMADKVESYIEKDIGRSIRIKDSDDKDTKSIIKESLDSWLKNTLPALKRVGAI